MRSRAHSSSAFCRGHDGIRPTHSRPSTAGRLVPSSAALHTVLTSLVVSGSTPRPDTVYPGARCGVGQMPAAAQGTLPRGSGGMADAHGSGPCARKGVRVQLPPSPPVVARLARAGHFRCHARRCGARSDVVITTFAGPTADRGRPRHTRNWRQDPRDPRKTPSRSLLQHRKLWCPERLVRSTPGATKGSCLSHPGIGRVGRSLFRHEKRRVWRRF